MSLSSSSYSIMNYDGKGKKAISGNLLKSDFTQTWFLWLWQTPVLDQNWAHVYEKNLLASIPGLADALLQSNVAALSAIAECEITGKCLDRLAINTMSVMSAPRLNQGKLVIPSELQPLISRPLVPTPSLIGEGVCSSVSRCYVLRRNKSSTIHAVTF